MRFNTSTLGYKLTSGQLREKRRHSEQLNKYLAGLIDADGSFHIVFSNGTPHLRFQLKQSFSNDPDGVLLRALRDYYDLGVINFKTPESSTHTAVTMWNLGVKDTLILYNRIGKHLRIKGTHVENLRYIHQELRGSKLTSSQKEELKEFFKCSRENSKWLKHPKHLSWAWVAGFLDGDGHYRFRIRERKGRLVNELKISFLTRDYFIVDQFLKDFKGGSHYRKTDRAREWSRGLGRGHSCFSVKFLKNMRKYSCLEKKYLIIDSMVKFHEVSAETKRIKSDRISDSPKTKV